MSDTNNITVTQVVFKPNGSMVVTSNGKNRTYQPGQLVIDGAFNPNLPSFSLALLVVDLYQTIEGLENRIKQLESHNDEH